MEDIMIDGYFDLRTKNGDFDIDESTEQHIKLVVVSEKGDWRRVPYLGAGVQTALKDEASQTQLRQEIQKHCELDGLRNVQVTFNPLIVSGRYNS